MLRTQEDANRDSRDASDERRGVRPEGSRKHPPHTATVRLRQGVGLKMGRMKPRLKAA